MKKQLFLLCTVFLSCDPKSENKVEKQPEPVVEVPATEITKEEPIEVSPKVVAENYICYKGNGNSKLNISVAFDQNGDGIEVKYKGQTEAIPLQLIDEKMENDGAYPVITTIYNEMVDGKKNGVYKLEHSGNWEYAEYTRGRDGKVFKFTIDHDLTVGEGDGYRTTPCF